MSLCMEGNVQSGRTRLLNACVPAHCKNTGSVGTPGWDIAIAFIYQTLSHCRKKMFVTVPAVAFSFQAAWFLALRKSCLAAAFADTALLEQSSLLLSWVWRDTATSFSGVYRRLASTWHWEVWSEDGQLTAFITALALCVTYSKTHELHPRGWELRFLETMTYFRLPICRFSSATWELLFYPYPLHITILYLLY